MSDVYFDGMIKTVQSTFSYIHVTVMLANVIRTKNHEL